ncbi:hypothetical protein CALCODRAFT_474549 [Calocera cornea HHB12733]|uniref:Peptidase S9 prolyl oligopeptidase catalytic domain-containing protein n=1 Tax=Calocera cornea HHB12733 TaxID=1353952 RepID=A0A165DU78_9BASI|nr:hypothetical protein CALCODRAFT_474549 [Calocera cornea HHB12733]
MRSLIYIPACALLVISPLLTGVGGSKQHAMTAPGTSDALEATVDAAWSVLGPFPQQAREQHFLSPAFPFPAASLPPADEIGSNRTWPSALADGGEVGWGTVAMQEWEVDISYPDVRWKDIRSTGGWAALQHHSLLHTTVTIPPLIVPYQLELRLSQASFFCLLPRSVATPSTPHWHHANIYGLKHYPPTLLQIAASAEEQVYDLWVSADYEIRLFGDPLFSTGGDQPITHIGVDVALRAIRHGPEPLHAEDVTPEFVDGWAFGSAFGIGIRAGSVGVELDGVEVDGVSGPDIQFIIAYKSLDRKWSLAPLQTRIIPLRISQSGPIPAAVESIPFSISFSTPDRAHAYIVDVDIPIKHRRPWWTHKEHETLLSTYLLSGLPQAFVALPPLSPNPAGSVAAPVILGLHGAGVSLEFPFWPASVDRKEHNWAVFASGGTEWGSDWHGVSASDAWGTVASLRAFISTCKAGWQAFTPGDATVVIGHSNGGQGTWYLTSRFPDLVSASVPTSAWLTPPHYVPLTFSRSVHFVDSKLRGVLDAALMSDGNDLFLSNVQGVKNGVMAVHGGADENVPVWMTREAVGLARAWGADKVAYLEVPDKPHWWDDTFRSPRVSGFLSHVLAAPTFGPPAELPEKWTITAVNPAEMGTMFGWSIDELEQPGRLARLEVQRTWRDEDTVILDVKTTNVDSFTVGEVGHTTQLRINGGAVGALRRGVHRASEGSWKHMGLGPTVPMAPAAPISSIFVSSGPLTIVVPQSSEHAQLVGARLAHALFLYLRVDAEVITDAEVTPHDTTLKLLQGSKLSTENSIIIGGYENTLTRALLERKKSAFSFDSSHRLQLAGRTFAEPSTGVLFLHPHPGSDSAMALIMAGSDEAGLERALRALPLRTGVAVPQWLVVGEDADWMGMGGVDAAGWWTRSWGVSQEMSWFS